MNAAKRIAMIADAACAALTGIVQEGEYKRRLLAAHGITKSLARAVLNVDDFDELIAELRQVLFIYTVPKAPVRVTTTCRCANENGPHGAGNNPGLDCAGAYRCGICRTAYRCEHLTVETPAVSMADIVSSPKVGGAA